MRHLGRIVCSVFGPVIDTRLAYVHKSQKEYNSPIGYLLTCSRDAQSCNATCSAEVARFESARDEEVLRQCEVYLILHRPVGQHTVIASFELLHVGVTHTAGLQGDVQPISQRSLVYQ